MLGAIRVGRRKKVQPILSWKISRRLLGILFLMTGVGYTITYFLDITMLRFFVIAAVLNLGVLRISLPSVKKIARGLTTEEAAVDASL